MVVKSRRLKEIQAGSLPENMHFCRKCNEVKLRNQFHKAIDPYIDTSNLFSVCKECLNSIYLLHLEKENGSIQMAIFKMCRTFNVLYNELAIESALKQIATKNWSPSKIFGVYLSKIIVFARSTTTDDAKSMDLTYKDSPNIVITGEKTHQDKSFGDAKDLEVFWGTDNKDEIEFLEREFIAFKKTHKADTHAEVTLLKEVCHKLWDIDKNRKLDKATDSGVKQVMELMKNLAISPNAAIAGSGKEDDVFGLWIKDIEQTTPAEWVKDKNILKDVDNIEEYFQTYIVSPIRSLITGNKEFTIEGTTVDNDEDD